VSKGGEEGRYGKGEQERFGKESPERGTRKVKPERKVRKGWSGKGEQERFGRVGKYEEKENLSNLSFKFLI